MSFDTEGSSSSGQFFCPPSPPDPRPSPVFHVMAKPTGAACNLACDYCFYLEKRALFGSGIQARMSDEVLQAFVTAYIGSQPTPEVEFVWQGGEPTLVRIDFFRKVIALQAPWAGRKTIRNVLQTNGTLLTDEWCRFLHEHDFLVGISLDGPQVIHDRYRRDRAGKGSFACEVGQQNDGRRQELLSQLNAIVVELRYLGVTTSQLQQLIFGGDNP